MSLWGLLDFFTGWMPFLLPTNDVEAPKEMHARWKLIIICLQLHRPKAAETCAAARGFQRIGLCSVPSEEH